MGLPELDPKGLAMETVGFAFDPKVINLFWQ
jgi:hypothetical protein